MKHLPLAAIAAAVALSGCVSSVKDVTTSPNTPRLTQSFDKHWRTAYQAINAAALQCDSTVRSSEDTATSTGTVTSVILERVMYVVTVRGVGTGSTVTVDMPINSARQRKIWPTLLDRWVNQGDRTTCPRDVL